MQKIRKLLCQPLFWTVAAAVVAAALLGGLAIQRYYNLESCEDLAMFDQMLWNVRNGKGLFTTISGETSLLFRHHFFGEHVSPILYLFAWPAGLTRGPEALLILQALVFSLSAIPLARWAGGIFKNNWAGLAAGVFWLLMPDLWLAVLYDWHMEAAEPLFIFAFVLALGRGSRWAWLWAVLYAACKEDAPIYLAFVSVIFGWLSRRRALGAKVAVFAAGYALLAWFVIGPACSASGHHQLVARALSPHRCGGWRPWFNAVFFSDGRWEALVRHLLSFGFLPLLGGIAILPAAAAVGADWLSISAFQFRMMMHYPFTVYPLLMLSAVWGAGWLVDRKQAAPAGRGLKKLFCSLPAIAAAVGLIFSWKLSLADIRERIGTGGKDWKNTSAILESLPKDGRWAALLQLVSHCDRRDDVTVLMAPQDADWLVVRLHGPVYTCPENEYRQWLIGLLRGTNYGVYCRPNNTVAVLKKSHATNENGNALAELLWVMEENDVEHEIGSVGRDAEGLDGRAWIAGENERGLLWHGAYRDLPAGRYLARFRVRTKAKTGAPAARLEVAEECGKNLLSELDISGATGGYVWKTMEVTLLGAGGAECRLLKTGKGMVALDRVEWVPLEIGAGFPEK